MTKWPPRYATACTYQTDKTVCMACPSGDAKTPVITGVRSRYFFIRGCTLRLSRLSMRPVYNPYQPSASDYIDTSHNKMKWN